MNKLLKDAIADAKAVRETALANAKLALEEALCSKIAIYAFFKNPRWKWMKKSQ